MKWSQILELQDTDGCFIGGHSHHHPRLEEMSFKDKVITVKADTGLMIESFKSNLGFMPCMFAFPYNNRDALYERYLLKNWIFDFYDSRRIDINNLL